MRSHITLVLLLVPGCTLALAQEKKTTLAAIKEQATAAMNKAEVKDFRLAETENLVVASNLPEARSKTLADTLQKTYVMAATALKFEDEEIKSLRAIVYTFTDVDQFRQFQRAVLKTRPGPDEYAASDVRGDIPFIAVSARRGEKSPAFDQLAGQEICRALLQKKGGNARLTEWMKDGFARAVQMRVSPGTIGTDRSAVLRMAPRLAKTAKANPVVDRAWSGTGRDKDLVAASLMDFLTFGPGAEKFGTLLSSLVPADGNNNPTFDSALKGAEWMIEDLDRAWREWIARGSPVVKSP